MLETLKHYKHINLYKEIICVIIYTEMNKILTISKKFKGDVQKWSTLIMFLKR